MNLLDIEHNCLRLTGLLELIFKNLDSLSNLQEN